MQVGNGAEELKRVSGDAADQWRAEGRKPVEAARLGQLAGVVAGGVEVVAVLDKLGAQGLHGGVLFPVVAVRHDDGRGHGEPLGGEGDALAVVAARRRDNTRDIGVGAAQPVH